MGMFSQCCPNANQFENGMGDQPINRNDLCLNENKQHATIILPSENYRSSTIRVAEFFTIPLQRARFGEIGLLKLI